MVSSIFYENDLMQGRRGKVSPARVYFFGKLRSLLSSPVHEMAVTATATKSLQHHIHENIWGMVNTLIVEISQEKNNFHFEPNNFCPYIVSD
jgi:hypothetical protein